MFVYDDDYPEDEPLSCAHEEYDVTDPVNRRCQCLYCGYSWYQTMEEIEREEEADRLYEEHCQREERRERIARFIDKLAFWRRWRKPALFDDEIPF